MSYEDLTQKIKNEALPQPEYYTLILEHSQEILFRTALVPHHIVAQELGMSSPAFSNALKFIKAYYALTLKD